MTAQVTSWGAAAAALFLAIAAGVADARRTRRANLDESGWMPWRGVQVTGIFAALLFAILAFHFR